MTEPEILQIMNLQETVKNKGKIGAEAEAMLRGLANIPKDVSSEEIHDMVSRLGLTIEDFMETFGED